MNLKEACVQVFGEESISYGSDVSVNLYDATFNAGHLFQLCALCDCAPEELFISWDAGNGCPTCGGDSAELSIELRRRKLRRRNA